MVSLILSLQFYGVVIVLCSYQEARSSPRSFSKDSSGLCSRDSQRVATEGEYYESIGRLHDNVIFLLRPESFRVLLASFSFSFRLLLSNPGSSK